MGGTATRKQLAVSSGKSRSSNTTKRNTKHPDSTPAIKQAAKKKSKKWSKDRAERVREALDRDADLMYETLGKSASTMPISANQTDTVRSLTENMQTLGK